MTPTSLPSFSRRAVCLGGAVSAAGLFAPLGAWAHDFPASSGQGERMTIAPGGPLHLRGVRPGAHAVLRTHGAVAVETARGGAARAWRFTENTAVSWSAPVAGGVIERRRGRLQLTPMDSGKIIEIATGPVEEFVSADGTAATLAITRAGRSLIVTAATLTPSDVWQIADDPGSAALPAGLSEFRVFKDAGDGLPRHVYWALRSPWLAVLGEAVPQTRLIWRGQGRLAAWRELAAPDFV